MEKATDGELVAAAILASRVVERQRDAISPQKVYAVVMHHYHVALREIREKTPAVRMSDHLAILQAMQRRDTE